MPAPVEPTMASLVAAGSLCLAAGGLYGWGGLTLALTDKFNLGSAQIDEVFSVAMFAFSGAILLSARLPPPLRGFWPRRLPVGRVPVPRCWRPWLQAIRIS